MRGIRWGIQWHSQNSLDGDSKFFIWNSPTEPILFLTRKEAREYVKQKFSYIKERPDLQREPHGWKTPQVKRVKVELTEV